jgi:hypothetical protein
VASPEPNKTSIAVHLLKQIADAGQPRWTPRIRFETRLSFFLGI